MEVLATYFQQLGPNLDEKHQQFQHIRQGLSALGESLRQMENRIQQLTGETTNYGQPSIKHEASLLIAPVMTDLVDAIPIKSLRRLVKPLMGVYPTVEQTHQLIEHSQQFQLTGLIQFARDRIAADQHFELLSCVWFDDSSRSCLHYELRPTACRKFEVSSDPCRMSRWDVGIDV